MPNSAPPTPLPATAWLPLLREALEQTGCFRWPLRGTSMTPTLPAECEVEVRPLPSPVKLGELIVFVWDDTLIAHRLVRRMGDLWIAQGDHRLSPDRPLHPDQVLGRVAAAYLHDQRCWPRRTSPRWIWLARYQGLRVVRGLRNVWRRSLKR